MVYLDSRGRAMVTRGDRLVAADRRVESGKQAEGCSAVLVGSAVVGSGNKVGYS